MSNFGNIDCQYVKYFITQNIVIQIDIYINLYLIHNKYYEK